MSTVTALPTPFVVLDKPRAKRNIAAMQQRASAANVRLRPHAKTHKSPVVAKWQIEAGAVGICCAKLSEAEVFAAAGIADIRVPYPVQPSNADRVIALLDRTRLSIIVDDLDVARGWSDAMTRARRTLDVLVKVDVGFHRCGVNPESAQVVDVVREIAGLSGLNFRGLLSHAGHSYGAASAEAIEEIAVREAAILRGLAEQLRAKGTAVDEISVGSTPTSRFISRQSGVTEMRPGNYVFFDRSQVGLGSAALDDCALAVISTVVSRPVPTRVIFDAGAKTLTSDGLRGFHGGAGHGLVCLDLEGGKPDAAVVIERLSEEHGVARVQAACTLKPGDRVRIVPNHSCVVTNMVDEFVVVDGARVVERLPVAARGRIW